MKAGSTATCNVLWSLGVAGLDEDGAVPDDGGSEDGGPVNGVSVRDGSCRAIRAALWNM